MVMMPVITVYTVGIKITVFIRDRVRQSGKSRLAALACLISFPAAVDDGGLSFEFLVSVKKPAHGTRQRP